MADVAPTELCCPICGYDLRGTPGDICPECGRPFDRAALARTAIPWEHRRRAGRWAAFWRTAAVATLVPRRWSYEARHALSLPAAQRFRWTVVISTWLVLAVPLTIEQRRWSRGKPSLDQRVATLLSADLNGAGLGRNTELTVRDEILACWIYGLAIPLLPAACLLLALAGISGVATYAFHPDSLHPQRQRSAVALAYYASAPLLLLTMAIVPWLFWWVQGSWRLSDPAASMPARAAVAIGVVTVGCTPLLMLRSTLVFLHHAAARRGAALVAAVVGIVVAWVGIVVLTLLILPAAIGFLRLAAMSLAS